MTIPPVRLIPTADIEAMRDQALKTRNEPLFQVTNELLGVRARPRSGEITAESLVSAQDRRGRVRVAWHDNEAYLDVDIAIGLGQSIIEAGVSARIDALLTAQLLELGLDPMALAAFMSAVRGARRIDDTKPPQ